MVRALDGQVPISASINHAPSLSHTAVHRELRLEPRPRWDSRVGGEGTPSQPTWQGGQQQRHFLPQLLARLCLLPWKL